ncbi:Oidioi.mRNA.OKI2018_I69.chr1.g3462.t1.cds [Oikopleura dioica]|uniref:Oidioi.mRNA.OKI2018_I69.chr1.g3462.t1.cds n=1 Tax=Oikopleura dioica TaxID=34765 RepID=A0ABN7SYH6_OIKDI|nr:Oidioi.mRNA.OKI2018_I69.chr1.g3462.t1.cds [Oikopleura dioica]
MAAVQPWHRVLRYGALALGVYHGKYAYDQLAVIRANERKEEIEVAKAYMEQTHIANKLVEEEGKRDSYLFGTKLPEAPNAAPYNATNDILLTLEGPNKLHPHLQALWEANKDKAPFGNHITNGKKDLFPGPQQYIASLPTPLMGRARSSFDNQVLTLNFLIEVNKKLGIDTSKVENIVFPNIVRDENNVVKVVGGTAAPACAWTSTL